MILEGKSDKYPNTEGSTAMGNHPVDRTPITNKDKSMMMSDSNKQ